MRFLQSQACVGQMKGHVKQGCTILPGNTVFAVTAFGQPLAEVLIRAKGLPCIV
jgi:hypothetical protein